MYISTILLIESPAPTIVAPENSSWFTPPVIAALVSSGIAALLGGFVGAYLKEYYSETFLKKRRLREIRVAINLNAAALFRAVRPYLTNGNVAKFFKTLMDIVEPDDTEESIVANKLAFGEPLVKLQPTVDAQYKILSDYESQLISLAYECEAYLPLKDYQQLVKFIKQITNLTKRDFYALDYRGMTRDQVLREFESKSESAVVKKIEELDKEYDKVAEQINNILKVKKK